MRGIISDLLGGASVAQADAEKAEKEAPEPEQDVQEARPRREPLKRIGTLKATAKSSKAFDPHDL